MSMENPMSGMGMGNKREVLKKVAEEYYSVLGQILKKVEQKTGQLDSKNAYNETRNILGASKDFGELVEEAVSNRESNGRLLSFMIENGDPESNFILEQNLEHAKDELEKLSSRE